MKINGMVALGRNNGGDYTAVWSIYGESRSLLTHLILHVEQEEVGKCFWELGKKLFIVGYSHYSYQIIQYAIPAPFIH